MVKMLPNGDVVHGDKVYHDIVCSRTKKDGTPDLRTANKKPWTGWLKNDEHLKRREASATLTDRDVKKLIKKIETMPKYCTPIDFKDPEEAKSYKVYESMLRHRDIALISLTWIFFKRGNEILHVKFEDITITNTELLVSLFIEKKQKHYKFCLNCTDKNKKPTKNSLKSQFCKHCGCDIKQLAPTLVGAKPERKTKRKAIDNYFSKYIVRWYQDMEGMGAERKWWMFPRSHYFSKYRFLFTGKKPLSIQRFNQILQRLDPSLTSSMFRYGGAEKWLSLGYTPYDVRDVGDWSSSAMPERYAKKKGLTPKQREFSKDNREI